MVDRNSAYVTQSIRIIRILSEKISLEEAFHVYDKLESSAKEADVLVSRLLTDPEVTSLYDVDSYDGLALKIKPPATLPIHFIRDGLWSLTSLCHSNLFADIFFDGKKYHTNRLLEWFRKDLEFTRWRLEELERSGSISIMDPKKVRIVKLPR